MINKKWIKLFSLSLVAVMMAGTITGCQVNPAEEIQKGNITLDNNENIEMIDEDLQITTMDAYLNLDLDMFQLFGKPLSDWTYDGLLQYISTTYEKAQVETIYDSYTGAPIYIYGNLETDKLSISVIEGQSIQVTIDGTFYNMVKTEGDYSLWTLTSYTPSAKDIVSSICGQNLKTYLDSVCPGLYDQLQEEPSVYLRDGMAMADAVNNDSQRIALCTVDGNLELWYKDGIIESLTVLFTEE